MFIQKITVAKKYFNQKHILSIDKNSNYFFKNKCNHLSTAADCWWQLNTAYEKESPTRKMKFGSTSALALILKLHLFFSWQLASALDSC